MCSSSESHYPKKPNIKQDVFIFGAKNKKQSSKLSNQNENRWPSGFFTDNKEDWKEVDEQKIMYVMEESRLLLQSLWNGRERLVQKSSFLCGLVIAIFVLSCSSLLTGEGLFYKMNIIGKVLFSIYIISLMFVFLFFLYPHQAPLKSEAIGTQPKDIFKKEKMRCTFRQIVVNQIENYQASIDDNIQQNLRIGRDIYISTFLILILPLCIIVIYSLFLFFC